MDVLWWFYTIVLGAAFAQLSLALAVQWKIRAGTGEPLHAPTVLWLVFLLIFTIEVWIAVGYYIRSTSSMSVISLLAFLWVPMGVLILAAFLSDGTWGATAPGTDEERFSRLRRSFFTVLLSIPVVNFVHEWALGSLGVDADLLFPGLIAIGAIIGFTIRGLRADTILAGAMVIVITVYLLTSYGTVAQI